MPGGAAEAIPFLEELVNENPQQALLRRALAEEYRQAERVPDAVAQLDKLGESLLNAGDRDGAVQTIEAIIAMNPPNQANYRVLLAKDSKSPIPSSSKLDRHQSDRSQRGKNSCPLRMVKTLVQEHPCQQNSGTGIKRTEHGRHI